MTSALKSTLRRVAVLLALIMLFSAQAALAAGDPIDVTISLSPESLSAPGKVDVSIRVANVSGADMTAPVTLYDPLGKVVAGFGDGGSALLKAEEFRTVSGSWSVTQDQLDAGEVVYTAKYKDAAGKDVSVKAAAPIAYTGETVDLQVSRTLSPEVVRAGTTASVVYELYNAGTVDLSAIKVTEKIASKNPQSVQTLKAGEKKTLTFTAKMGSNDLKSSAKITYKAAGDTKSRELSVEELVIPVAVKGLDIKLAADKASVNIGDTVVLTMTVENKGNISYSGVTVTDEKLGTVFEDLSIAAGDTFTKDKEVTVLGPTKYAFTVKLADNTGMTNTLTTNAVPVSAYDPEKELKLTLLLTADKESVESMPADVAMTLIVTNVSSVDCEKVVVSHGAEEIYTIASLKAGQSETIRRDYTISQAGQFRFTAATKDVIGNAVSFDSNTLAIAYAAPTAVPTTVPEATIAPLVTIAPAGYNDVDASLRGTRNALYTAAWVLALLFAGCLVLFIISTAVRMSKKHQSAQAYDHLELGERRDYTEPAGEKTAESESAEPGEQTESGEESIDLTGVLPHEKLLKQSAEEEPGFDIPDPVPPEQLIKPDETDEGAPKEAPQDAVAQDAAQASPDETARRPLKAPETDGMGGYRMKRETPRDAQTNDADETEAKPRRRRAAKKERGDQSEEE